MKQILLLIAVFFAIQSTSAQLNINEYSAANLEGYLDNYNRTEDWIEIYNAGDMDMDISGYHLSDKTSKPGKWEIPEGTIIPGKGYKVFWCSGRDEACDEGYHTNFKLSQTKGGETLLLTDPSEQILDEIEVEFTLVESSRCRRFDGNGEWMVCPNPTLGSNNQSVVKYKGYTEVPSADMEAGFYSGAISVSLQNNSPGTTLRYTMDGTNPTETSPQYFGPISINETTVIKAQSFSNDDEILTGKMDFNTYFIDEDFTLPVFSVAADDVQRLANGEGTIIPIGSLEYFNRDKEREATSFGSLNRHGQDSWVLDHRSIDWVSRDEMGYSKAVNAPLFAHSERDEYQKFMFRNSGDDNYPAINDGNHDGSTHIRDEYVQSLAQEGGLKLDVRSVERVVLFLNGDYWGVYGMRDRPVDHDYTDYYYDQGKYDVQYLTTWGDTELQYGGQQALNDWYRLRNFILENDMSDSVNYELVTDELNVVSLMDYMIVNLNCVASDWLNYNTGWWRGTNPDGDHKKWGYILWDLDATFDYYINYSGVPDISPNAAPCDIEQISNFMDGFFNGNPGETGPGGVSCVVEVNPLTCESITNGSSPYDVTDSIFQLVINQDQDCCSNWDDVCQSQYDEIESGGLPDVSQCPSVNNSNFPYEADDPIVAQVIDAVPQCCNGWGNFCNNVYDFISNGGGVSQDVDGNVGQHEKIFLKLQEESPIFRQLYYSRQADLQNTVYSCENMISTLDRMLSVIEPEMPRQIDRWGGTMTEWESNVQRLKNFIEQRCELFDEGMNSCFGLEGPYDLTLMVEPEGVGEIDLNTLDHEEFPWTGAYYGNMDNKIKAKALVDGFEFSHWESRAGNVIAPSDMSRKATIQLTVPDTLVAVFRNLTSIEDISEAARMKVFPNPTSGAINLSYDLAESMDVRVSLMNMMGQELKVFSNAGGARSSGLHTATLDIEEGIAPSGMYLIKLRAENLDLTRKISIIR